MNQIISPAQCDPSCWPPFPGQCPPPQCGCGSNVIYVPCIPPPVMPPKTGPIQGVVDGSQAAPGMVGEVFYSTVTASFPITTLTQNINSGVLPPGDWNIQAQCACVAAWTTGVYFNLSPQPTGFTTDMRTVSGTIDVAAAPGTSIIDTYLLSQTIQANVAVPTLIPFSVTTNYAGPATGQPTGTILFTVFARRMR